MTDQQIITLIRQQKHSKAFTRLYRYFPPVQKLVLARGGSKNDALDIYQDALVILCKKAEDPGFALTASLNTYLYSVCRFLWNDALKKQKRKGELSLHENYDMPEEELNEWVEAEEKFHHTESVLAQVGKKCLQLLQYFYTDGLSMKTIARKMEFTSENVAKNQKYKCLEKAKNLLKSSHATVHKH